MPQTYPPPCVICEALASVIGEELGLALRELRRLLFQPCACGYWLAVHSSVHPHPRGKFCPGPEERKAGTAI